VTWYKKADNLGADDYRYNIRVNIYGPSQVDIAATDSVPVNFSINVEAREWGIKYIGVVLSETINVPYIVTNEDETEMVGSIDVYLSKVEQKKSSGAGSFTVGDLDLLLDDNFAVNYDGTAITVLTY